MATSECEAYVPCQMERQFGLESTEFTQSRRTERSKLPQKLHLLVMKKQPEENPDKNPSEDYCELLN